MTPTLDRQIQWFANISKMLIGSQEMSAAVLESLKRLKAIDEGRGQWVDTGVRE